MVVAENQRVAARAPLIATPAFGAEAQAAPDRDELELP